jgi:integrase
VKPFDGDLCARVLVAVRGNPLEAMYYLALATGARESEFLGLRWMDVAGDHVIITSKLDEKSRKLGDTKTDGSRRRVDIPIEIGELLVGHHARNASRGFGIGAMDYVFLNQRGGPVGASNLRRTWRTLRVKHGLPADYRNYDLRHTHASVLAAAGIASKIIAERLGHEGTRITDDTYSHLMPGMQVAATSLIGDVLRAALPAERP